jgi:signal peptidase I
MTLKRWILLAVILGMLTGCNEPWDSGDRVLVTKCNDLLLGPSRYDVVVFKYPQGPVDKNTPKNYIKRLLGLPGEILAIFFGRVYHRVPEKPGELFYDDVKDAKADPLDLWKRQYMHADDKKAHDWFQEGKFTILRKPPGVMLALRRIVYDNDFQAKDLVGKLDRWSPHPDSAWKTDKATSFTSDGKTADQIDWLRYQHLVRADEIDGWPKPAAGVKKMLILDTLDYNTAMTDGGNEQDFFRRMYAEAHWVGDLMLECNVDVVEAKGEFCLELSRGINRFQASFDLATGTCTLYRLSGVGKNCKRDEPPLAVRPTNLKAPGNYLVRFANFDSCLTVWVDRDLPFRDCKECEYDPPEVRGPKDKDLPNEAIEARRGPTDNDFEPASVGSKGANVKISHLRLWRDIYYRTQVSSTDHDISMTRDGWSQGSPQLDEMRSKMRFVTMYVQPGHYLCLGDNSQASSDSRDWGLVPQRLMLGRALAVYFPIERIGPIR